MKDDQGITIMISALPLLTALLLAPPATLHAADVINRPEEAAAFYRQAADKYVESRDAANEGSVRNNLAATLHKLRRLDEARQEIRQAIECDAQFGHASSPWAAWAILALIETDADNPAAEATGKAIACYLA
jgi:Tfp pilus assembly protein PilF